MDTLALTGAMDHEEACVRLDVKVPNPVTGCAGRVEDGDVHVE